MPDHCIAAAKKEGKIMSLQPKVSVVVPVYNSEEYLAQCVDSLLAQTLDEIEVVLVDDGSPDGSGAICDAYAQKDPRVKVVHKPNGGLVSARIAGVNTATAPYVGFVDGDDFAAPEMYETLYRAAAENSADIVSCSYYLYWNDDRIQPFAWEFPKAVYSGDRLVKEFYPIWFENRKEGHRGMIKSVWSKLYNRAMLADIYTTMETNVTVDEDMMATFAVIARAECVVTLPDEHLLYYRQVDGSMQNNYWKNYYNNEVFLLDHLRTMKRRPEADPFVQEGMERQEAYCIYQILYNETKPNRRSTPAQRRQIIHDLMNDGRWQEAVKRDVIRADNQTPRLFQKFLLARKPGMVWLVMELATLKNKLSQVIHHG